jgi:hypothetical protein
MRNGQNAADALEAIRGGSARTPTDRQRLKEQGSRILAKARERGILRSLMAPTARKASRALAHPRAMMEGRQPTKVVRIKARPMILIAPGISAPDHTQPLVALVVVEEREEYDQEHAAIQLAKIEGLMDGGGRPLELDAAGLWAAVAAQFAAVAAEGGGRPSPRGRDLPALARGRSHRDPAGLDALRCPRRGDPRYRR